MFSGRNFSFDKWINSKSENQRKKASFTKRKARIFNLRFPEEERLTETNEDKRKIWLMPDVKCSWKRFITPRSGQAGWEHASGRLEARREKKDSEKQSTEVSDAAIWKDWKSFVVEGKIHRYIVICNGSSPKHTRASHVPCTRTRRAHVRHTHIPTHRSKQIHNTCTHTWDWKGRAEDSRMNPSRLEMGVMAILLSL